MFDIRKCCSEISNALSDKRSKKEFFDDIVRERLFDLCKKEEDELDLLLRKLEVSIESGSKHQIKMCINKLYKILYRDRNHLVQSLWRMM